MASSIARSAAKEAHTSFLRKSDSEDGRDSTLWCAARGMRLLSVVAPSAAPWYLRTSAVERREAGLRKWAKPEPALGEGPALPKSHYQTGRRPDALTNLLGPEPDRRSSFHRSSIVEQETFFFLWEAQIKVDLELCRVAPPTAC